MAADISSDPASLGWEEGVRSSSPLVEGCGDRLSPFDCINKVNKNKAGFKCSP